MKVQFLLFSLFIFSASCTTTAKVNYQPFNAFSSENAGNKTFEELEQITVSKYGFYGWNCDILAKEALSEAAKQAKNIGGNALMAVRWLYKEKYPKKTPVCHRFLWATLLGYWHIKTTLVATVIKIDPAKKMTSNIILLEHQNSNITSLLRP